MDIILQYNMHMTKQLKQYYASINGRSHNSKNELYIHILAYLQNKQGA